MIEVLPKPVRLRFSVDDYYKMIDLGILKDYEKSEIIGGELRKKMTIGDKHAITVNFLNRFFNKHLPESVMVSVQNPLRLTDFDEPEPDIVLTDLTKYDGMRHPRPEETLLVVEVADKTLKYDREIKLPLYAKATIPEVWIVNLPEKKIEVYKDPENTDFNSIEIFTADGEIRASVLPETPLLVEKIIK